MALSICALVVNPHTFANMFFPYPGNCVLFLFAKHHCLFSPSRADPCPSKTMGRQKYLRGLPFLHQTPPGPGGMWTIRSEMAGYQGKNLKKRFHGQNDISCSPLGRPRTRTMLIGVADQCQPQAGFLQMTRDIPGKPSSILFRTERVKTAPVKYKPKRGPFDVVLEKIDGHEPAINLRFGRFFFCLLYGNVRRVRSDNLEAVPGKPYGIVSGSTTDIQYVAPRNRFLGHNFHKIEIRLADVPRRVPGFVSFPVPIFDGHLMAPHKKFVRVQEVRTP
jgi:hypothetical protein